MIAAHPDADHIGGLDEVLKAYKVEAVYAPKVSHTTKAYKDFLTAVKIKLSIKGVTAKFIGPVKSYGNIDLNNWGAVLHVAYGKNHFCLLAMLRQKQKMI